MNTPAGETTLIRDVTAVSGTFATTAVAVGGMTGVVATSPNRMRFTVARFVPVIVTKEPRKPDSGTNDVIVGRAKVGEGVGGSVGDGDGVRTGWNVGNTIVGSAMVGGAGGVKLGATVSAGDGMTEIEGRAGNEGDTLTIGTTEVGSASGVAELVAVAPSPASVGVGVASAAFSRSQPERRSAKTMKPAMRFLTRPRRG